MTAFAVIGDLHLSEKSPRYQHALEMLRWAIRDAREHGAKHFFFLGDLFEGKPAPGEYGEFISIMLDLASTGIVGIVRGNHESYDALCFFEGLSPMIRVAWEETRLVELDGLKFLLIPYPVRHRKPFHDLDDSSISASMKAAGDRIRGWVSSHAGRLVVLGHFTVEGMTTRDTEFELHQSNEVVVPVSAFEGAALTIVGHIHKAQRVSPTVIGAGDLYRCSFAEADDPKGYALVRLLPTGEVTATFMPVPAREMVQIELELDDVTPTQVEQLAMRVSGREVKIITRMDEEAAARYDPDAFKAIDVAAALVVKEKDVRPKQRVRAPEISLSTSVVDQFVAWLHATDQQVESDRLTRLLEKIEALG